MVAESLQQAKKKLQVLADRVTAGLLHTYGNSGHLGVEGRLYSIDAFGDGPCFRLATVQHSRGVLAIWLDYSKFWGGDERRVWLGVYSSRRLIHSDNTLRSISRVARKTGRHTRVLGQFERFVPPLQPKEFNKAIEEDYSPQQVFVGIYTDTKIDHPSLPKTLVGWTKAWLPGVIEEADNIEDKEWRSHHLIERVNRSAMLALVAKRNSNFACEVGDFRFNEKYGELGEGYLEAHHLLPVAQKTGREWDAKAGSLAALCSDCHRMLHVLLRRKPIKSVSQGRSRVSELQRIVRRYEK